MGALYTYRQDSFGITERDNIRTQWKMEFVHRLRSLPKKYIEEGRFIGGFTVPDHPSEIISVVSGHDEIMMLSYNPDEIFIDIYLNKQTVARDIEFKLRNPITEILSRRRSRKSSNSSRRKTTSENT
jgi:hypothetical protein